MDPTGVQIQAAQHVRLQKAQVPELHSQDQTSAALPAFERQKRTKSTNTKVKGKGKGKNAIPPVMPSLIGSSVCCFFFSDEC